MNVEIGKFVRIVFKSNSIIQGTVEKWTEKETIILNEEKNSRYIVYNLSKNAILVQIDEETPMQELRTFVDSLEDVDNIAIPDDIEPLLEEVLEAEKDNEIIDVDAWAEKLGTDISLEPIADPVLRAKKLAELKIMEIELERSEVKKQMTKPIATSYEQGYRTPNFGRKQ